MNPWIVAQLAFLGLQLLSGVIWRKTDSDWAYTAGNVLMVANLICCAMYFVTR